MKRSPSSADSGPSRAGSSGAAPIGTVTIEVDGVRLAAESGRSVAAALPAGGIRALRHTTTGEPRGLFCGIGTCFECATVIDGVAHVRSCLTPVADGMRITIAPSGGEAP
jgi:predicted molibdopterin-dependent oxidoreductase YjgC